jgi:peptide/nickel transport system permease protein
MVAGACDMSRRWWWLPVLMVPALIAVGRFATPDTRRGQGVPFAPPSAQHWLGTDARSQDVVAKLAHGGWTLTLAAAVIAVGVTVVAATLGASVALRPRWASAMSWLTDATMLVPPVLLMLLALALWPHGGVWALVILAIFTGTPYSARVMAGVAAPVVASGFVQVAEAAGERLPQLIFREVLPNLRGTIATQLGLRYVEAIYVVSTAAFLQLTPAVGDDNWAVMVRVNAPGLLLNPASVVAPAVAIAALAVTINIIVLTHRSSSGATR